MSYNGPLNVATGKRTELGELIKIIASELNISNGLEIVEGQETPGDINGIIGDINLVAVIESVSHDLYIKFLCPLFFVLCSLFLILLN